MNVWADEGAAGAAAPVGVRDAKMVTYADTAVMYGGVDATSGVSDFLYVFDPDTQEWALEVAGGGSATPVARFGHTMVSPESAPHKVYVFSGCSDASCTPASSATNMLPFSSIYQVFDMVSKEWTTVSDAGGSFVDPRVGAVAGYWVDPAAPLDPTSEYFVIYGGYTPSAGKRDKTYLFQVATNSFIELPILAAPANPPALADACGFVVGNTFYVWGGHDYVGGSYSNTIYALDLVANTWSIVSAANAPAGRAGASCGIVDQTSLLIAGGYTGTTMLGDTAVVNMTSTSATSWVPLASVLGSPAVRGAAAATVLLDNLFVFGGLDGSTTRASATVASNGLTYFTRPVVISSTPGGGQTCAQETVTVTGRMFANVPGLSCFFAGIASPATFTSPTSLTCQAAIPDVRNSVSAVAIQVGRVSNLPSSERTGVTFLYAEDQSSAVTTAPIGLPSGGEAGTIVPFQIQTRAVCGIERLTQYLAPPLTGTNDMVQLQVTDLNAPSPSPYFVPVSFSTQPNEFGRYDAALNTTVASRYRLNVILNTLFVADTPTVVIAPALPDASSANTFLITPAPGTTESQAGAPFTFTFVAQDEYGNDVVTPGLFTASAVLDGSSPPVVILATILPPGTGSTTLTAQFPASITTSAGSYTVTVYTAHNNAPFGSFSQVITPAELDITKTTASGGILIGRVGQETTIFVQPRDRFSNPRVSPGLDFDISLLGSSAVSGTVEENSATNVYEAKYTATRVGQYSVDISLNSVSIQDSPFSITIQVGNIQSITNSIAFGSGLSSVVAGKEGFFIVQSRDPFNNLVPFGGLNISVTSEAIKSASVSDRGDGSYMVTYEAKHLGHFGDQKICVTQYGQHVRGSPFDVEVEYGVVFFVIVFLAVLIVSILIAIGCTWAFNKAHRRYQYKILMRNPDKVFPTVEDEHADGDDPWLADPDWAEGGGVPLDDLPVDLNDVDVADADGGFDVHDLVDDFHDDDVGAANNDMAVPMSNIAQN